MKNRALIFLLFILIYTYSFGDVPVTIRRICVNGSNNEIFFTPSVDPCNQHFKYQVWGRIGAFGPFSLLDSIPFKSANQYTHVDANVGGTKSWSYFVVTLDSCGPDYSTISDTVAIDRTPPETIYIDSVSIDPITNTPHIGWRMNSSPDFSYFKLYGIKGVNTPIFPFSKDTFYVDLRIGSSPVTEALRYDLSSVDSCGLETVFERNQHASMYLTAKSDTCSRKVNLSWSPYIGWGKIRRQYIYRQLATGNFILVDSIAPDKTSYIDTITLGVSYKYFVRAFKDTTGREISASSNSVIITTRERKEPKNSYLSLVSIDQPGQERVTIHIYNPEEEVTRYAIQSSSEENGIYTSIGSIPSASQTQKNYSLSIPFVPSNKFFYALAINACNESFSTTNKARYSSLTAIGREIKNIVFWEPYFTWNTSVDYYTIFRGTSDDNGIITYEFLATVPVTDTSYTDENLPAQVGETGVCYYVEAVQQPGDVNGATEHSFSTQGCAIGQTTVFIPTAFHPNGYNKTFRPEGRFIDYEQSKMEIYDRWGAKTVSYLNIRGGWDGKDSNGILCMPGVYYYKIYIKSTNVKEKEKVYIGFITLLD